jgi:plastocyanin
MLSTYILRAVVITAALTCTTGSASAEQYRVLVMEEAFFPEISYLLPGDEVIFVNMAGETRDLAATDGSWTVEGLADGSEASLMIASGMPNLFGALAPDGDAANMVMGTMNFSGPPVAD